MDKAKLESDGNILSDVYEVNNEKYYSPCFTDPFMV
jgi:hypothetical protein